MKGKKDQRIRNNALQLDSSARRDPTEKKSFLLKVIRRTQQYRCSIRLFIMRSPWQRKSKNWPCHASDLKRKSAFNVRWNYGKGYSSENQKNTFLMILLNMCLFNKIKTSATTGATSTWTCVKLNFFINNNSSSTNNNNSNNNINNSLFFSRSWECILRPFLFRYANIGLGGKTFHWSKTSSGQSSANWHIRRRKNKLRRKPAHFRL